MVKRCIEFEHLEIAPPDFTDPDADVYLYIERKKTQKDSIRSVLIAYDLGESLEVTAFTDPERRCQGYFTSLFLKLIADHEDVPVCFYTDGCSYDALKTLEVIDAEYEGTEHVMSLKSTLDASAETSETVRICPAGAQDLPRLADIHSRAFGLEEDESLAFLEDVLSRGDSLFLFRADTEGLDTDDHRDNTKPDHVIGLCALSVSEGGTGLYGFCIDPDAQQKGYGTTALAGLLDGAGIRYPVTLHVTEENKAAFRLYSGAGFVSIQELMEYWY